LKLLLVKKPSNVQADMKPSLEPPQWKPGLLATEQAEYTVLPHFGECHPAATSDRYATGANRKPVDLPKTQSLKHVPMPLTAKAANLKWGCLQLKDIAGA
jgi:hypothetical protein